MAVKLIPADRQVLEDHDQWYWPVASAVIAVAVAVPLVVQHDAIAPPRAAALWAGLAGLPWLVDAVLVPFKRTGTPASSS